MRRKPGFTALGTHSKNIFITIELETKSTLFDVTLKIPEKFLIVSPGGKVLAEIEIIDIGQAGEVEVEAYTTIKDSEENIIAETRKNLTVNERTNFIESFDLPKKISPGKYVFYTTITYNGQIAVGSGIFTIGTQYNKRLYIIILLTIIILGIIIYVIKRKKSKTKPKTKTKTKRKPKEKKK